MIHFFTKLKLERSFREDAILLIDKYPNEFGQIVDSEVVFREAYSRKEYYKSQDWLELRKLALNRDGNKCCECGIEKNLQVHHKKYRQVSNEIHDLETLCRDCHQSKHDSMKVGQ